MKKVLKYEEFVDEKLNLKTAALGAMLGASTLIGCDTHDGIAKLDNTEVIGNQKFKEYELYAKGQQFKLTINGDFTVAYHSYSESHGSGKNRHTEVHNIHNLFIPEGVKFIWYESKTFGGIFASPKPFPGAHLIKMSELEIYEDTPNYTLYNKKGFLSSCAFDYIVVMKKDAKIEGEEFNFSDKHLGIYSCEKINKNLYIFIVKSLGSGRFGGAGAGGSF
jgi:hypothetical protein